MREDVRGLFDGDAAAGGEHLFVALAVKQRTQIITRVRRLDHGDFLRRADGDEQPAVRAGFGAEVHEVVGAFDDFEVVLDDEQAVALFDQTLENAHEQRHVVEVQPGGGFVKDQERAGRVRDCARARPDG